MFSLKKDWPALLIVVLMAVAGYMSYPYLPDKVPSHWDVQGQVNGYMTKLHYVIFIPALTIAIYFLLCITPKFDPRKDNYSKFAKPYQTIKLALVIFFGLMYSATMFYALGYLSDMTLAVRFIISGLFILLGNYFGKLRQNYFVGLKFPWTLADEEVWNKTHRLGGKLWVSAGVIGLVSVMLPAKLAFTVFISALILSTLITVVYSYLIYQQKHKVQ